ncbi:DUF1822 family protein [Candidatus Gracilibacteria bacterium]|nr:DUF1822 family protein [Candidatus Gracilibacteria bacterium]NJM89819.1 DUF1822 family protein [Hydrococcus sp. RU_2_2]
MSANTDPCIFPVPLALSAHLQAKKFRSYQSNPHKATQVYLNTLAVYATNYYLQCLGFKTNLEKSDSWNPTLQTLMDVADLEVVDCGKLECRALMTQTNYLWVPAEVWSDRIGCVAVQFDESLRQATLLGFTEKATECKLEITQLRSLELFPGYLNRLRQPNQVIKLDRWLENIFEAGWSAANDLFIAPKPAFNFRGGDRMEIPPLENSLPVVKRRKLLNLEAIAEKVVLMVGLMPTNEREREVWVKLFPDGDRTHLPPNLQLMVLDETGEALMQATARSTESILLKFSGEVGEYFSLKIALDNLSLSEAFII